MPTCKRGRRVHWKGFESVANVERQLAAQHRVSILIADNYHHVLCVRLCPRARLYGNLLVQGGPELLGAIAAVPGLHDFADLVEPARAANATVDVSSPPAQIRLTPTRGHAPAAERLRHGGTR